MPNYWLMKTEPNTFSIQDLEKAPHQTTCWEGVRNYQARNMLRDDVKKGDMVLFYHSNTEPVGVHGTAKVVKPGYPDHFQFEPKSKYYDPKASPERPRWFMVDIKHQQTFQQPVTLQTLRTVDALQDMKLLQKGQRLSVQPVTKTQWDLIVKMGATRS
ncbi:MAG: EVE domain-containing protein [Deltaproteobacteria bacterium]|nr:EVE domain-containing protein [Deltaproteobacteria bacterium]